MQKKALEKGVSPHLGNWEGGVHLLGTLIVEGRLWKQASGSGLIYQGL